MIRKEIWLAGRGGECRGWRSNMGELLVGSVCLSFHFLFALPPSNDGGP